MLSPQSLQPLLTSWSVNYFFDHNHACGLLNISALHVQYGIQAFTKFSVQNALDCISENFNLKNFPRGACTRNSLEKCAVCSPDGRYCAHIATVYYISRPILSQNPLSAPGKVVFFLFPIYLFIYSFVHTSYFEVLLQGIIYNMYLSLKSMYTVSFSNFRRNRFLIS